MTLPIRRVLGCCNKMSLLKCIFIDLSGTLHIDDDQTPRAAETLKRFFNYCCTVEDFEVCAAHTFSPAGYIRYVSREPICMYRWRLRTTDLSLRFVTNTTKESTKTLLNRLNNIGFELTEKEIFSSLNAAISYIKSNNLNPFYILSSDALTDFPPVNESSERDAVVIGSSPKDFHYENINKAFNILLNKHPLIAIHEGKYFKTKDGLTVGPGCFTRGLEYAANTKAIIVGKPNPFFFKSALPDGVLPEECVMIGDDPIDDVQGAMKIGMKGILVRTGKFRSDVVTEPPPTVTVDNFAAAVDWLFDQNLIK